MGSIRLAGSIQCLPLPQALSKYRIQRADKHLKWFFCSTGVLIICDGINSSVFPVHTALV